MMAAIFSKIRLLLLALPREVVAALWRLILTVILAFLYLLKFIIGRLKFKPKCDNPDWPRRSRCCKVPEQVKRKPDPCLYSQSYRMSQGLSVTWDNPDIMITLPDGTVVNSTELQADTDYIVRSKISNASFDPALATEVRCFYRPWSFNSADTTPVELTAQGDEAVRLIHIPPWQNVVADFTWHTPPSAGHYCLQVKCSHPDDINPNNNLGQENTRVMKVDAGKKQLLHALLVNELPVTQTMRVFVDQFVTPDSTIALDLKTLKIPLRKPHQFDALHRLMLSHEMRDSKLALAGQRAPHITRYAYTGWDEIKKQMTRGLHAVPRNWGVRVDGNDLEEGWTELVMQPNEEREVSLAFTAPVGLERQAAYSLNFTAVNARGKTLGGVTVRMIVNA